MNFVSKVFNNTEEFLKAISHDDYIVFKNCVFSGINVEVATSEEEGQSDSNNEKIVQYVCFNNCTFEVCKFYHLDFIEVAFTQCNFSDSEFNSLKLESVIFEYSHMYDCTFNEVNLSYSHFGNCSLMNIHFSESTWLRLTISHSELSRVHMTKCVVPYVTITYSNVNIYFNTCTDVSMYLYLSQISIRFNDAPKYPDIKFHHCDIRKFIVNDKKQYITQISGIGQRHDCTTYNICTDNVRCGCWTTHKEDNIVIPNHNFAKGGNLDEFRSRVQATYKRKGDVNSDDIAPSPYQIHHRNEYDAAIRFFREVNESYKQLQLQLSKEEE